MDGAERVDDGERIAGLIRIIEIALEMAADLGLQNAAFMLDMARLDAVENLDGSNGFR